MFVFISISRIEPKCLFLVQSILRRRGELSCSLHDVGALEIEASHFSFEKWSGNQHVQGFVNFLTV